MIPTASEHMIDFIGACLRYNPHSRITAREALQHPVFGFSSKTSNIHKDTSIYSPVSGGRNRVTTSVQTAAHIYSIGLPRPDELTVLMQNAYPNLSSGTIASPVIERRQSGPAFAAEVARERPNDLAYRLEKHDVLRSGKTDCRLTGTPSQPLVDSQPRLSPFSSMCTYAAQHNTSPLR